MRKKTKLLKSDFFIRQYKRKKIGVLVGIIIISILWLPIINAYADALVK